jgi:1-deoxy-D-xylulose-5-phosphate reductoisomerase
MSLAIHDRESVGVAILGSTGSIGRQTLQVIDAHPDRFHVVALAARRLSPQFLEQVERYRPDVAALGEHQRAIDSSAKQFITGDAGLLAVALHPSTDIVVVATSGHAAIAPTLHAVEQGKTVALANKESLVCAGELIMPRVSRETAQLRPVDSEHSAIWQALGDAAPASVERIILTASGGPFRTIPAEELALVTAQDALAHPTWRMGGKITIDSATLMNKGLEIIEAHWLFGVPYSKIEVVVHPESVVHSLVEFVDGAQVAQLGLPDMRLPIQFALSYPERLPLNDKRLNLAEVRSLHFEPPDEDRFPALGLARQAGIAGRTYPTVLSVADEVAVAAFMEGQLRFTDIPRVVESALAKHHPSATSLESIAEAATWAATTARAEIAAHGRIESSTGVHGPA